MADLQNMAAPQIRPPQIPEYEELGKQLHNTREVLQERQLDLERELKDVSIQIAAHDAALAAIADNTNQGGMTRG